MHYNWYIPLIEWFINIPKNYRNVGWNFKIKKFKIFTRNLNPNFRSLRNFSNSEPRFFPVAGFVSVIKIELGRQLNSLSASRERHQPILKNHTLIAIYPPILGMIINMKSCWIFLKCNISLASTRVIRPQFANYPNYSIFGQKL